MLSVGIIKETDLAYRLHQIRDVLLVSAIMCLLTAVVRRARPGLRAASAQGGAPHAPRVVGPTHLGRSWRRRGGTVDQIRQSG